MGFYPVSMRMDQALFTELLKVIPPAPGVAPSGKSENEAAMETPLIPTPQPVNDGSLPAVTRTVRDLVPPGVPMDLRELGEVVHHETPGYKPLTTQ